MPCYCTTPNASRNPKRKMLCVFTHSSPCLLTFRTLIQTPGVPYFGKPPRSLHFDFWSPLHHAAKLGVPDIISLLLSRGADLNYCLPTESYSTSSLPVYGLSALDISLRYNNELCSQLLIKRASVQCPHLVIQAGVLCLERFSTGIFHGLPPNADSFFAILLQDNSTASVIPSIWAEYNYRCTLKSVF